MDKLDKLEVSFFLPRPSHILQCYTKLICLKYNHLGYWPVYVDLDQNDLNPEGVTDDILASAEIGSMCGWDVEGAKLAKDYAEARLKKMTEQLNNPPPEFEHIPVRGGGMLSIPMADYVAMVDTLIEKGVSRSDAQGIADAHFVNVATNEEGVLAQ